MKKYALLFLLSFPALFSPIKAQSWSYTVDNAAIFSSPKASDLNNDGYPDIIIGTGNENLLAPEGILALDGRNGQKLWSYPASNQLYSSAVFMDINEDGTSDVFLGGRKGLFFCIDGQNGQLLWEFDPGHFGHFPDSTAYNLYTPALVPDQNNDGYQDLVNVYGGGTVQVGNNRPPGWLILMSGKTGEVLAADSMPDGRESYSSPLVHDFDRDGDPEILFGSGEERRGGKLWRCSLSELLGNDISSAEILAEDSLKGFIAVSSLADFNQDGVLDIAAPGLNKSLILIDGQNGDVLFSHTEEEHEHYTTPVLGNFTGDATPDVFCVFQRGVWPFYSNYKFVLLDGSTGQVAWDSIFTRYQLSQFVALNSDEDPFDELIICHNQDTGFTTVEYTHQIKLLDFQDDTTYSLLPVGSGLNVLSSPLLSDFDGDGKAEITYAHALDSDKYYTVDSSRIQHHELDFAAVHSIAWGAYMGNDGDGVLRRRDLAPTAILPPISGNKSIVFPNPGNGLFYIDQSTTPAIRWEIFTLDGKRITQGSGSSFYIDGPNGVYMARIYVSDTFQRVLVVKRD